MTKLYFIWCVEQTLSGELKFTLRNPGTMNDTKGFTLEELLSHWDRDNWRYQVVKKDGSKVDVERIPKDKTSRAERHYLRTVPDKTELNNLTNIDICRPNSSDE